MIHIVNLKEGLPYFKALSSDVRIDILDLLTKNNQLNMQDIANKLGLTSGTITMHIKKLSECGLVEVSSIPGKQGIQKMCYLPKDKIIIDIGHESSENTYESEVSVPSSSTLEPKPPIRILWSLPKNLQLLQLLQFLLLDHLVHHHPQYPPLLLRSMRKLLLDLVLLQLLSLFPVFLTVFLQTQHLFS